ncbi:MAG: hypothetical protein AAF411_01660 [Myxococcota bacterium]
MKVRYAAAIVLVLSLASAVSAQSRPPQLLVSELRLQLSSDLPPSEWDTERPPRERRRDVRTRRTAARWFTTLGAGMALAGSVSMATWGRRYYCHPGPERTARRLSAASLAIGLSTTIIGAIRLARRHRGARRAEIVRTIFGSLLFAGVHFGTLSAASFGIHFCST